jgi:hypothetical protein
MSFQAPLNSYEFRVKYRKGCTGVPDKSTKFDVGPNVSAEEIHRSYFGKDV